MRKIMIAGGLALVTLAGVAGAATAQNVGQNASDAPQRQGRHAERMARADVDHDGRISQAEFVNGRVERLAALDADRDGTVTADEMRAGLQNRIAERAGDRFDALDANHDGALSRAEFEAGAAMRGDGRGHRMGHGMGRGGHGERAGRMGRERGPVVIADLQSKLTTAFQSADANHDGYLDPAEQQAGRAALRDRMQERRAERRAHRQGRTEAPASLSAPATE